MERETLFEFAGGMPAMLRLAAAHHARCLVDPALEHPFSHTSRPDHVERLAAYWAEALGGPSAFSDECASEQSEMLRIHANTGADAEFGPAFVACFLRAMDDAGLPEEGEFRSAMRAYIEWATADVMQYAPMDAVVPPSLSVPRWSWDGPVGSAS